VGSRFDRLALSEAIALRQQLAVENLRKGKLKVAEGKCCAEKNPTNKAVGD